MLILSNQSFLVNCTFWISHLHLLTSNSCIQEKLLVFHSLDRGGVDHLFPRTKPPKLYLSSIKHHHHHHHHHQRQLQLQLQLNFNFNFTITITSTSTSTASSSAHSAPSHIPCAPARRRPRDSRRRAGPHQRFRPADSPPPPETAGEGVYRRRCRSPRAQGPRGRRHELL